MFFIRFFKQKNAKHSTLFVYFLRSEKNMKNQKKALKTYQKLGLTLKNKTFYTIKYEQGTKKY